MERREKILFLDQYMSYRRLPVALRKRIFNYYATISTVTGDFDEDEIFQELPSSLRLEVGTPCPLSMQGRVSFLHVETACTLSMQR